jgi:hypothetical protein
MRFPRIMSKKWGTDYPEQGVVMLEATKWPL